MFLVGDRALVARPTLQTYFFALATAEPWDIWVPWDSWDPYVPFFLQQRESEGTGDRIMRRTVKTAILLGLTFLPLTLAGAQNPNEKDIKPAPNIQDKDEIF